MSTSSANDSSKHPANPCAVVATPTPTPQPVSAAARPTLVSRAGHALTTGADLVVTGTDMIDGVSASADAVSPFVQALVDASPALAGAWGATSSVLQAIADAPMVGPAARLLLLFAQGIQSVAGYADLVERARRQVSDLAQALKDIDAMVPKGMTPPPSLGLWVERLQQALDDAVTSNKAALAAPDRPSFVSRLLCAVRGAVFDAARLQAALDDLDKQWCVCGDVRDVAGCSLHSAPTSMNASTGSRWHPP